MHAYTHTPVQGVTADNNQMAQGGCAVNLLVCINLSVCAFPMSVTPDDVCVCRADAGQHMVWADVCVSYVHTCPHTSKKKMCRGRVCARWCMVCVSKYLASSQNLFFNVCLCLSLSRLFSKALLILGFVLELLFDSEKCVFFSVLFSYVLKPCLISW